MSSAEDDGRTGRFRPFFNPATGEHIQYTVVAESLSFERRREPVEHGVEGVCQSSQFVVGSVEIDALVEVAGR